MPSSLRIEKICENCGTKFIAKQMRTRFCSGKCAHSFAEKERRKEKKLAEPEPVARPRRAAKKPVHTKTNVEILNDEVQRIAEIQTRPYISVAEASRLYGISTDTIRRQIANGKIPAINLGERLTRIDRGALEKLFHPTPTPTSQSFDQEPQAPKQTEAPVLEGCYTITDIVNKYDVIQPRASAIINKYKLPKTRIGKYCFVPKDQADAIFSKLKTLQK